MFLDVCESDIDWEKRRLEFPPDGWSKQELVDVDG